MKGKMKKELSNNIREKPIVTFRSNLSLETLRYIRKLALQKQKATFINQAIEMKYFLLTNKRQFLKQILQENYALCRYLLRKIGKK